MTEPRPACDGHYELFWTFMDSPSNPWLRKEAASFCGTCPIRDACLEHHIGLGGDDRIWAAAIHRELSRPKARPCDYCGKQMELKNNAGRRRRYCDDVCGHADRAASREAVLKDIPQRLRNAHAEHCRLRSHGVAIADIPDDLRFQEREYQAMRHAARQAKKVVA